MRADLMLQALFIIDKDRIQPMIVEAEKIYDTDNMQEVYEDTLIRDIDTYLVEYCYLGEGEGLQLDGPRLIPKNLQVFTDGERYYVIGQNSELDSIIQWVGSAVATIVSGGTIMGATDIILNFEAALTVSESDDGNVITMVEWHTTRSLFDIIEGIKKYSEQ